MLLLHHYPRTPCGQALLLRHHYQRPFAGKPYFHVIITREHLAGSLEPSRDFFWLLTAFPLYFPSVIIIRGDHYNASTGFGLWAKALRSGFNTYNTFSILTTQVNSAFLVRCLVNSEVISKVLFTSEQAKRNKMVDTNLAASQLGKYPPLFTSTLVNNC